MAEISLELVKKLRDKTGIGMMDCKKALEEANGDIEKAVELLRKKGAAVAEKRSGNATGEGLVHSYIHPGSRVGVMIEINCETDFVARTIDMIKFANDLCMQIAAFRPVCISSTEVDPQLVAKEKEIYREQLKDKPASALDKIIEGKIQKYYAEVCLLNQTFIKDEKLTVDDVLKGLIAKVGEIVKINRFVRYEIGK